MWQCIRECVQGGDRQQSVKSLVNRLSKPVLASATSTESGAAVKLRTRMCARILIVLLHADKLSVLENTGIFDNRYEGSLWWCGNK
jgi:hypothetical protein